MWQWLFTRQHKTPPLSPGQAQEKSSGPVPGAGSQTPVDIEHRLNEIPGLRYDFGLFRPRAGETPQVMGMWNNGGFPATAPDSQKEGLKRRVADALTAQNPQLRIYPFDFDQIARFEHISVEEARRRHRHLELSGPEDGNGIQIVLHDDEAVVSVPYWHKGEKAAEAFLQLWRYLEILKKETGYAIYDAQLGRFLAPTEDCTEALARYNETVRHIREPRPVIAAKSLTPGIQELAAPGYAGAVMLAIQPAGAICGFADICVRDNDGMAYAYLRGWYVESEHLGSGIGGLLLDAVERWAAARGLTALVSDTKLPQARPTRVPLLSRLSKTYAAGRYIKSIPVSS